MISEKEKKQLEQQQYRIVGKNNHSAVKICGWTKNMIRGIGGCYKLKFYGINSSQCLQMSPSLSCANRCVFCWRGYKAPVSKEWKWNIDDPLEIYTESVKAQNKLLEGFNGFKGADKKIYEDSKTIKHVALSLTGEPIIYPRINELIKIFNKEKISTFLVTNAQYPDKIKELNPVTQLYLSLDAGNKELLKKIDLPLFEDYWERLNLSLEYLSKKEQRTCIRITLIKGLNINDINGYSKLIKKGNPDFVEVKAYMHVGESIKRLKRENMPSHREVLEFARELNKQLTDYEIVSEHKPSFVILLAKKEFKINNKWNNWIDFEKYNKLVLKGNNFKTGDYLKKTPEELVGIEE